MMNFSLSQLKVVASNLSFLFSFEVEGNKSKKISYINSINSFLELNQNAVFTVALTENEISLHGEGEESIFKVSDFTKEDMLKLLLGESLEYKSQRKIEKKEEKRPSWQKYLIESIGFYKIVGNLEPVLIYDPDEIITFYSFIYLNQSTDSYKLIGNLPPLQEIKTPLVGVFEYGSKNPHTVKVISTLKSQRKLDKKERDNGKTHLKNGERVFENGEKGNHPHKQNVKSKVSWGTKFSAPEITTISAYRITVPDHLELKNFPGKQFLSCEDNGNIVLSVIPLNGGMRKIANIGYVTKFEPSQYLSWQPTTTENYCYMKELREMTHYNVDGLPSFIESPYFTIEKTGDSQTPYRAFYQNDKMPKRSHIGNLELLDDVTVIDWQFIDDKWLPYQELLVKLFYPKKGTAKSSELVKVSAEIQDNSKYLLVQTTLEKMSNSQKRKLVFAAIKLQEEFKYPSVLGEEKSNKQLKRLQGFLTEKPSINTSNLEGILMEFWSTQEIKGLINTRPLPKKQVESTTSSYVERVTYKQKVK